MKGIRESSGILALLLLLALAAGAQTGARGAGADGAGAPEARGNAVRPPRDLARRVAQNETLIKELRDRYTFRQSFVFEELSPQGGRQGWYKEIRDIVYSPGEGRDEVLVQLPANSLSRIKLTEEDFHDVREIQNFLFTEDVLWLYRIRFKGEETVAGEPCWVMEVSPKNQLDGMRFFEGLMWVSKKDEEIVQASGLAVPEMRTTKNENLFPRFTTVRSKIDGHWFPTAAYADDRLTFSTGAQRVRFSLEFADYKRFDADSTIRFEGNAPVQ